MSTLPPPGGASAGPAVQDMPDDDRQASAEDGPTRRYGIELGRGPVRLHTGSVRRAGADCRNGWSVDMVRVEQRDCASCDGPVAAMRSEHEF